MVRALLRKEYLLALRNMQDILLPLFFILMLVLLFPLSIGIETQHLKSMAAGILFIAILLSALLGAERHFKGDFSDGTLVHIALSGQSMFKFIGAKCMVAWLVHIAPLLFSLPLFGLFYMLSIPEMAIIALTIGIASPTILLFAMLGCALTLSIERSGMLLVLIILPFYLPTLVFAVATVHSFQQGFATSGHFMILASLLMASLAIIPIAIVGALKISLPSE